MTNDEGRRANDEGTHGGAGRGVREPGRAAPSPEPDTPLSQKTARTLLWVEKYPLPLLYGWFAWRRWETLRAVYREYQAAASVSATLAPDWRNLYYATLGKNALLCALMIFTGAALLLNRAPSVLPDKLKHVVIPVAASYYFILYSLVDTLPPPWRENFAPRAWWPSLTLAGIGCSVLGYAVALWALCYLRRSFAMMVAVRRVVLGGPYRYVRHPMYLGYLLDTAGLLLVTCSRAMGVLVAGFVLLMAIRARLEEESLASASTEYKRHYWRTGFFFPRWRRVSGK